MPAKLSGRLAAIARLGNANAASDVVVAVELLLAAASGARANVEINLESLDDAAYVARLREEVAEIDRHVQAWLPALAGRMRRRSIDWRQPSLPS